ncbi:putative protein LONGIFOLIA 1/2 [Helianthus annuus]|uniref:Putative DUF3741-associated sequence motif protein n=1 Tax=Helianthus annuus TaxID=4232 RepID=A0A251VL89_HELAN|nr:protein LONGIFOLIA 1 [Helianthus annuus]KAF5820589.1 putative protein LONGIFOLIA 1/2 [Helianthus annuus]KAJ0807572.1 putative protein LONGIFOLIA [Helianthus annuus]
MMTGLIQDQNLEKQIEKQIGCMSGFLHIFDRQQILTGKRIYSTKRLPSSTGADASPESVKSVKSVKFVHSNAIRETEKPVVKAEPDVTVPESPDRFQRSPAANSNVFPATTPPRSPLPLPIFEMKEGSMKNSWKFCKEMPRLSLDSRATVDSKGSLCAKEIQRTNDESYDKQRRSPSVIARLMGLDQLPSSSSDSVSSPETVKKPELRRSASESRVSRDLFHSRFIECNNSQVKQQLNQSDETNLNSIIRESAITANTNGNGNGNINRNVQSGRVMESMKYSRNQKNEAPKASQWRSPQQRRSFFDTADVFPEPKQTNVPVYVDSEKSLKLRGIDEQAKDLETLKHILEALQFKGLLHCNRPLTRDSQRNFVYDPSFLSDEVNTGHMKPWRSPGPNRRYSSEISPSASPRKDRGVVDRSGRSPVRARNSPNSKSGNTIVKRKLLTIETERRIHESSDSRRNSPINSPKLTPKRSGNRSDHYSVTNHSPRSNRSTETVYSKHKVVRNLLIEDESSSFSESSGSTTSQSDLERSKLEENREGKSLLARCDKLLHSIAEMNSITESHTSFNSVIPSPVSVLDSAFDKDESSSPSPVMKRSIDFKDLTVDLEEDIWRSVISPASSTKDDEFLFIADDSDFTYISEILRALKYVSDDSSVFYFLEKQQKARNSLENDTTRCSKLRRKLVFDAVNEIIDRNRELPPWKLTESNDSVNQICLEFQKIREPETAENLLDLICTLLKKDLAGNNVWSDQPVEVSEAVLYIERLIFKDLVSETIRDLAEFAGKTSMVFAPRRKLVF